MNVVILRGVDYIFNIAKRVKGRVLPGKELGGGGQVSVNGTNPDLKEEDLERSQKIPFQLTSTRAAI